MKAARCTRAFTLQNTMTEAQQRLERIALRLLDNIEQRLESEGGIEIKDYKAVTGALKELRELQQQGTGEEKQELVVKFLGEAEEMSG